MGEQFTSTSFTLFFFSGLCLLTSKSVVASAHGSFVFSLYFFLFILFVPSSSTNTNLERFLQGPLRVVVRVREDRLQHLAVRDGPVLRLLRPFHLPLLYALLLELISRHDREGGGFYFRRSAGMRTCGKRYTHTRTRLESETVRGLAGTVGRLIPLCSCLLARHPKRLQTDPRGAWALQRDLSPLR